jgi:transposase InsO family protein
VTVPTSVNSSASRAAGGLSHPGVGTRRAKTGGDRGQPGDITVERLITDNGSAYRATIHSIACRLLGIRRLRTRPYRPQTNGKAERFIRTLLAGWAYGAIYRSSTERTAALTGWLDWYNTRRPHGSLSHKPPIARLNELNNLLGSYT